MKKGIHPRMHKVNIQMTNGKTFETLSTWGKAGDTIVLDIDPHNHPAWTKVDRGAMENVSNVMKYRKKFGNFTFLNDKNSAEDNGSK